MKKLVLCVLVLSCFVILPSQSSFADYTFEQNLEAGEHVYVNGALFSIAIKSGPYLFTICPGSSVGCTVTLSSTNGPTFHYEEEKSEDGPIATVKYIGWN